MPAVIPSPSAGAEQLLQNQVSQASITTIQQIYGQKLGSGAKLPNAVDSSTGAVVASHTNSISNTPQSRIPNKIISGGCIGTKHASVVVESSTTKTTSAAKNTANTIVPTGGKLIMGTSSSSGAILLHMNGNRGSGGSSTQNAKQDKQLHHHFSRHASPGRGKLPALSSQRAVKTTQDGEDEESGSNLRLKLSKQLHHHHRNADHQQHESEAIVKLPQISDSMQHASEQSISKVIEATDP